VGICYVTFICAVAIFYLWHAFGVTIGLHRLLSHRAFRCPKFVEYFWVAGAYLAFHGSPVWWATIHRAHHRHVDTPLDPHSPVQGKWHAYTFYRFFEYPEHIDPPTQSIDLLSDPVYRLLECNGRWRLGYSINVIICLAFRLLLLIAFGPTIAAASLVAGLLALNMPLILNIICHIPSLGYRVYDTDDDSVNVWFMAIVGLGDGWHNNHHACPGSSRMGIRKWELDPSYALLCLMKKVGLVSTINNSIRPPELAQAAASTTSVPETSRIS
jgi:stearoyl-CoA desaturase (delta-9 desaturase)